MKNIIVKSASHLNDAQIAKIKDKAVEKYGKEVVIKFLVDADLIGGLVIFDDGKVTDSSVAKQLNNIKNYLKQEI